MIRIAIIGIVICIFAVWMKQIRVEYSFLILLLGSVLLGIYCIQQMKTILNLITMIQQKSGIPNGYLKILLKLIGISFLGDFVGNICKDAGQITIGKQVEMISKLSMLAVSLPILKALVLMIEKLMG